MSLPTTIPETAPYSLSRGLERIAPPAGQGRKQRRGGVWGGGEVQIAAMGGGGERPRENRISQCRIIHSPPFGRTQEFWQRNAPYKPPRVLRVWKKSRSNEIRIRPRVGGTDSASLMMILSAAPFI